MEKRELNKLIKRYQSEFFKVSPCPRCKSKLLHHNHRFFEQASSLNHNYFEINCIGCNFSLRRIEAHNLFSTWGNFDKVIDFDWCSFEKKVMNWDNLDLENILFQFYKEIDGEIGENEIYIPGGYLIRDDDRDAFYKMGRFKSDGSERCSQSDFLQKMVSFSPSKEENNLKPNQILLLKDRIREVF